MVGKNTNNAKKNTIVKNKNKKVFNIDFSRFDTGTGEKTADDSDRNLARMEAISEAKKTRVSPSNNEETIKDAATGGSLSFLVGNSAISKDSKRIKMLTALRKKSILGLAGAATAAFASHRKQKGEYNRQQASRELIAGKKTGRAKAYSEYLNSKYSGEK